MARMTTLHIIPLQINVRADGISALACDDPRASYDARTGTLTINILTDPNNPYPAQQSVRFVVRDPSSTDIKYYATLHSGYNADNMVQWHKDGDVSRSPYIPSGNTVEVWSTVLAIPDDPKAGKVYQNRNKLKIATKGAGDEIAIEG